MVVVFKSDLRNNCLAQGWQLLLALVVICDLPTNQGPSPKVVVSVTQSSQFSVLTPNTSAVWISKDVAEQQA